MDNTLDWINKKESTGFKEIDLLYIRDFTLVWNIFENKLDNPYNNDILLKRMRELEEGHLSITELERFINYFSRRYIDGENSVFNRSQLILYRRKKDDSDQKFEEENKKNTEAILTKLTVDNPTVISDSLLPIILRVRNNLFHGNKSIHNMEGQQELFERIIEFLQSLIDAIIESKR